MIFKMILHVLFTPSNFCFHDKVITSLPGVLGIKWSPLNIGIAFTEMSSKMQDCLFPNLGIVRNMKPTDVFFIFHSRKGIRTQTHWRKKLDHVWSCLHTLSNPWENFMFLTILSIRNMSQHKGQFPHLFVTNLPFIFMWVQFVKNQLNIWKKLWPLTIDHSGDDEDSISFFIFSYLQWNMITTRFTSNWNQLAGPLPFRPGSVLKIAQ